MKNEGVFEWNGQVCVGSRLPLELPKLTILNSAQSKYPLGGDEWILGTQEALRQYMGNGYAVVGSLGLNTWEYTTWGAGISGYPLLIVVLWNGKDDPRRMYQDTLQDLMLPAEATTLILLPSGNLSAKEWGPVRDHFVVSLANLVIPISIHSGGRMEWLLTTIRGKTVTGFEREWRKGARNEGYHFDIEHLQRDLDPRMEGWLIHWTHACQGPWPGETRAEYFQSVTTNWEEYAHSARKTMERIVHEKQIRPSSWRIRKQEGVVCFTGLPPSQAAHLMRWRARYVRYTIEPYGIGIQVTTAHRIGIQPVHYLEAGAVSPAGIPAFLLQGKGRCGRWPQENEYRHLGGIDLKTLAPDEWKSLDLTGFHRA